MIKVISQSTAERRQETIDLFNQCKPHLDNGDHLAKAVKKVTGTKANVYGQAWFKELRAYAESQGYHPKR